MKFTRFIFAFAIGILLWSCTNTSESDLIEQVEPEDVITYTEHIKPIYDNNCINCHSNPAINGASIFLAGINNEYSYEEELIHPVKS